LTGPAERSEGDPPRQHRAPTFYVDECLGRGIALKLPAEGHDAKAFDEFAGRPDVEFLPLIGGDALARCGRVERH
jgi:hypothetical protein